jgi:ADP-ribosylglycohydrolase
MLGAISGDIIGSIYEFVGFKSYEFPLFSDDSFFTDDTVLTIAVADALIHDLNIAETLKAYAIKFPNRGYGGSFDKWSRSTSLAPYNSWGNGSAMRTSPVAYFFDNEADVLKAAREFASVTHNHPEGVKGAQSTALAIFLARQGASKEDIKKYIQRWFGYDLNPTLEEIRPDYVFDVSCQGSVPKP